MATRSEHTCHLADGHARVPRCASCGCRTDRRARIAGDIEGVGAWREKLGTPYIYGSPHAAGCPERAPSRSVMRCACGDDESYPRSL